MRLSCELTPKSPRGTLRTIPSTSFTHKKHSSSAGLLPQAVTAPTLTPAVSTLVLHRSEREHGIQPGRRCQGPKMNRFQRKLLNRSQNIRTSANGQADNSTIAELLARRWTETRPYFTHRTPLFAWMMLGLSASAFLAACATVQVASDYEGAGLQGYRTAGRAHQQGRERSTCQIPTSVRPECLALLP
jgi:hypothetical protein